MIFQSFRSFVLVATVLTFESLLIAMDNHVHFECTFGIQLKATVRTHVHCVLMDIFVCLKNMLALISIFQLWTQSPFSFTHSQSCHIFEFLWTVWTLEGTFVTVYNLVLFQCALCNETLTTLLTNEWPVSSVNCTDVRLKLYYTHTLKYSKSFRCMYLHIDQFTKPFIAESTGMYEF